MKEIGGDALLLVGHFRLLCHHVLLIDTQQRANDSKLVLHLVFQCKQISIVVIECRKLVHQLLEAFNLFQGSNEIQALVIDLSLSLSLASVKWHYF